MPDPPDSAQTATSPASPDASMRLITGIYLGAAGALLAGSVAAGLYGLFGNPGTGSGEPGEWLHRVAGILIPLSLAGFWVNVAVCGLAIWGALAMRRGCEAGRRALLIVSWCWAAGVVMFGVVWLVGWWAVCFSDSASDAEPGALRVLAWLGGSVIDVIFVILLLGPLSFFIRALRSLKDRN